MLDGGTNCGKGGITMAAVHGPAGPLAARTTYGVTDHVIELCYFVSKLKWLKAHTQLS